MLTIDGIVVIADRVIISDECTGRACQLLMRNLGITWNEAGQFILPEYIKPIYQNG